MLRKSPQMVTGCEGKSAKHAVFPAKKGGVRKFSLKPNVGKYDGKMARHDEHYGIHLRYLLLDLPLILGPPWGRFNVTSAHFGTSGSRREDSPIMSCSNTPDLRGPSNGWGLAFWSRKTSLF